MAVYGVAVMSARDWTRPEVEAAVDAYLEMLILEIAGSDFIKKRFLERTHPLLDDRNIKALEWKLRNVSAALIDQGMPYVDGYKPAVNYQALVGQVVAERIANMPDLHTAVRAGVDAPVQAPAIQDILDAWERPPKRKRSGGTYAKDRRPPRIGTDYLRLEGENSALGLAGERFVVAYETARLIDERQERLASRIEHVAATRGDGLGYDVLSFEADGREKLIEVKTTRFGEFTPFYVTRNEVQVSRDTHDRYHLYRVYGFKQTPKLFGLSGPLDQVCVLDPVQYMGRVG